MRRRAWSYDRPPNPLDPGATSRLRRSAVTTAVLVLRNRCKGLGRVPAPPGPGRHFGRAPDPARVTDLPGRRGQPVTKSGRPWPV
ncbi:hypothetical protein FDG62_gp004 [Mycobacterium phage Nepal]|uniref:Uncharacterized protein n=1 Tax=Mycobacterium phage Nepal TaxID=2927981 RepID=I3WUB8_9CAUD|nr:hypothetical protein FDG62_gp004 [Mycobacterium phage Nepal]AFL46589.1 hypothetical protein NEPAL_4 [Mycobacterium phage Nepal]